MLKRTSFFIREHVGMFKLTDTYDILNPERRRRSARPARRSAVW